jgi:uncharacterized membrane protein
MFVRFRVDLPYLLTSTCGFANSPESIVMLPHQLAFVGQMMALYLLTWMLRKSGPPFLPFIAVTVVVLVGELVLHRWVWIFRLTTIRFGEIMPHAKVASGH